MSLHHPLNSTAMFVSLVSAALLMTDSVRAAETTIQNDSLTDGNQGQPCACFLTGESAASWLTSTCDGDIVAVQIFWRSQLGGPGSTLEAAITLFDGGVFPTPGAVLINQDTSQAIIQTPTLQAPVLNEYRHLDPSQTIPLGVAVQNGQTFVVSLEFFNTNFGSATAPTVVYDTDGCQTGLNAVHIPPPGGTGWTDACPQGVTGDWMIRAIVDCTPGDIPTVSAWGCVVMVLVIMAAGTGLFRTRLLRSA